MNGRELYQSKKLIIIMACILATGIFLCFRLGYLMIFQSDKYQKSARQIHERERQIKAPRGKIYDRNGIELAGNKSVCTISVIHCQIKNEQKVIDALSSNLDIDRKEVEKKVKKVSVREKIKSNVEKETADKIRKMNLAGVMVDEDYRRYYPYDMLFSKVLGFTGSDNQGIIGLEVKYDKILSGKPGAILTLTNASGIEIKNAAKRRKEAVAGNNLYTSLDINIQKYASQAAAKVMKEKQAKQVSMIVMNPQNGEIFAMVNLPEYHLNQPYSLGEGSDVKEGTKEYQDSLNKMWRNACVNDTYEPGSTFKIVTATGGLEEKVVSVNDSFSCPGFRIVEDRRIRCHKTTGHGAETFKQGVMNSCNPVFIDVGLRLGKEKFYANMKKLGLFEKTGIDVPGEAGSILHKIENVKSVELATMSFGQSFQITPLQLLRAASAVVNGGTLVTPHFGVKKENQTTKKVKKLSYPEKKHVISEETSKTMRELLNAVVSEGSGKNAKVEGYQIGGKTATSEKLPRRSGKYISSFLGFAPADHPSVMAIVLIDEPVGVYYGGTIAAPVVGDVFSNILPYLGVPKSYQEDESTEDAMSQIEDILD